MRIGRGTFLLLLLAAASASLLVLNRFHNRHAEYFFGFAENQETEMNVVEDARIMTVRVRAGESVRAGDTLLVLGIPDLDREIGQEALDRAGGIARGEVWRTELLYRIEAVRSQMAARRKALEDLQRIWDSERELQRRQLALLGLAGRDTLAQRNAWLAHQAEIESMKDALAKDSLELASLHAALAKGEVPLRIGLSKQEVDRERLLARQREQVLTAPADGQIGAIHGRVGEYRAAFSPLITFYEPHPSLVKGFVHESLLVGVALGDELEIGSVARPEHRCTGKVIGLGTRVVEIPERLRQFPEVPVYGREVLVSIPRENEFLQKEKVRLLLSGPSTPRHGG